MDSGVTTETRSTFPSEEEYARAVRYSRTREVLAIVGLVWSFASQAALGLSGGSARIRDRAERASGRRWANVALYGLMYGLVTRLLTLPLSYVRGYVVEHRYKLSNQTHADWLAEQGKATALGLALEVPLTIVTYEVIRRNPRRWWLILSGLALPFTVVLAQLYPVVIAPIFNKFVPLPDPSLADRVRALAERAGVRVADVTQMDMSKQTRKANAFFAGLGPTKRIALGDTLVEHFTPDEVEIVVAHELGHQVRGDIWKSVALSSVATLGVSYVVWRLAPGLLGRFAGRTGVDRVDDVAGTPMIGLLIGAISTVLGPFVNAFSRQMMERPADRYALEMTERPEAFISAMEKLARLNLQDPDPPKAIRILLHSHPSVAERIAFARGWRR